MSPSSSRCADVNLATNRQALLSHFDSRVPLDLNCIPSRPAVVDWPLTGKHTQCSYRLYFGKRLIILHL
ncbi:hypothetical protein M408DRAFT_129830 [Serendipita vermifera MAFF 305830]|uniref:Uncharacterized protein n=1 Tax=Serendipita vermifera MAFF 305830 TaxID=933852 RepID=A0A0C3A7L2_SERVB|nr:hypothetical protein M408DRAFT_129830 [Serendipita vermifera MAFF 305830]